MLGRVSKAFREGGVSLVARRAVRWSYETNGAIWYARDLSDPIVNPPVALRDVVVTSQRFSDVVRYMQKKDYFSVEEYDVALQKRHWFLALLHEDQVIGFRKCGSGAVYVADFRSTIALPQSWLFFYESEVDEAYRGRGLAKYFMAESLRLSRDAGYRYVLGHVPSWNKASQRVLEANGFRSIGYNRFIRLGSVRFHTHPVERMMRKAMSQFQTIK